MIPVALKIPIVVALATFSVVACATNDESSPVDQGAKIDPSTPGQSLPAPVVDAGDKVDGAPAPARDGGVAYTYGEWSTEWSTCNVTCGAGVQTRTRICKRRDGLEVSCTLCGGECTQTQPCTASTCCGPREECCPVMPYNVAGGTIAWCTMTVAQYAAACTSKGCLWTGATACTIGGSPSNATVPGGMGTCQ